ncbi:MAG TPA: phosphoribosyltransferase family protein, partial [Xanthomonadales bacterium]|nr:phosphoribosyltransferase family protein [Xanthomonadales bacterium]
GLHTDVWLELDAWFLDPANLQPQIDALANQLQPYAITAVCGPLVGGAFVAQSLAALLGVRFYFTERSTEPSSSGLFSAVYRLPAGVRTQAAHESFAVVDDVISAGSSTRATVSELNRCGARTVVVGALLLLGDRGERHFMDQSIPVVAAAREELSLWEPGSCPLCQAGMTVERRA